MIDRVQRQDAGALSASPASRAPVSLLDATGRPAPYLAVLLDVLRTRGTPEADGAGAVFGSSLRLAAIDALGRLAVAPPPAAAPPVPAATGAPAEPAALPTSDPAPPQPLKPPPLSKASEEAVIRQTAERKGIDPDFLRAIRRVENGRPGREFGVLSVSAPTYRDQANVAAETVRRTIARFERTGRHAIDATGRYTAEFIRFFSIRYAPVGAANDPTTLNRHHTRNLLRAYGVAPRDTAIG